MSNKKNKLSFTKSRRIRALILSLSVILIVLMFPDGQSLEFDVTVGSIWIRDDLIATKTFEILKDKQVYDNEVARAKSAVYPIFVLDESVKERSLDSLAAYNIMLLNTIDNEIFYNNNNVQNTLFLSPESYEEFKQLRFRESNISTENLATINQIFVATKYLLNRLYSRGLIDRNYDELDKDSIAVRDGKYETEVAKRNYYDPESAQRYLESYMRNNIEGDIDLINAAVEYTAYFAIPDIKSSSQLTELSTSIAARGVSMNKGFVTENERIVAKHDRITPDIKEKIDSYRISKGTQVGFWGNAVQILGKLFHIIIILIPFSVYIFLFRKKIYYDNSKILLIAITFLFICAQAFLASFVDLEFPIEFFIFVPIAPMLLTITFDSRIGFYSAVIISLITGGLRGNDYVFVVMNVVAGGLAAYTVRDVKNRTQIFRSFAFILIGYVTAIVAFGLEGFESPEKILLKIAFAAINAIISPALTYGLIIFAERIFKITTELTLLELTDFNVPLLKELARSAPGTFTHSVTIGSLVESASERIGANPILARVGAYYHDIGKALNPQEFVENQMDKNVHENLEPSASAQLIIEHVNKGIAWAKENKLPKEIVKFIPTHHGTMIVSFFYNKAVEMYGEENVNIDDFRYPGPKPDSKETALLMLADACESAVRAMEDPDPMKVENVISNIVNQRIEDGQLDESSLTFADIAKIKDAFLKGLIGQHHKRIRYPKQDELESESSEDRKQ